MIIRIILIIALTFTSGAFAEPRPMKVRQKSLNLEFEVYRTEDMPANCFKTYDEFYVTKRIDNNWVYGLHTMNGMVMTDIIVGTVDPSTMPELNEAYTYVPPGATPIYMPTLPPRMEEPQELFADIPPQAPQQSLPKQNLNLKGIDVFEFAKNATPQQLRDAVAQGVNFNLQCGKNF